MIYIVGLENSPEKRLHLIGVFVDASGAGNPCQGIGSAFLDNGLEFFCHKVQGFIPGGFSESVVFLDLRRGQSFVGINKIKPKPSLYTKAPLVGGTLFHPCYLENFFFLDMEPLLAATPRGDSLRISMPAFAFVVQDTTRSSSLFISTTHILQDPLEPPVSR